MMTISKQKSNKIRHRTTLRNAPQHMFSLVLVFFHDSYRGIQNNSTRSSEFSQDKYSLKTIEYWRQAQTLIFVRIIFGESEDPHLVDLASLMDFFYLLKISNSIEHLRFHLKPFEKCNRIFCLCFEASYVTLK